jgi:hypothetical protein
MKTGDRVSVIVSENRRVTDVSNNEVSAERIKQTS